jgi:tetratricopeptide (TPR) repeat protein
MIGSLIGPYRVDGLLGRGGMGEVYRAFDVRLGRAVALKMLPDHKRTDPAVERFLREARAASALNHPNIVTVHEIGETDGGAPYMVQELVEGRTLRSTLRAMPRLPLADVADVGRQVARALAAAHRAGIVHRDIKPENLMQRRDGYVKVLDFGLARVVVADDTHGDTLQHEGTAPGVVVGTSAYMSPEQAQGHPVGPASDVFSLGVVLYELATGTRPFSLDGGFAVLHAIVRSHPLPPSRHVPDLPSTFDGLIARMLAKDPVLRPSAEEVLKELDELAGRDRTPQAAVVTGRRRTVGRDREREELRQAFEAATAERGSVVAIAGEPGIGKSSLAEDFLAEIAAGPHHPMILRGKCSERLAGTEAYLPVLEALDNLLHAGATGDSFAEMMRQSAPVWYLQVAPLSSESSTTQLMRDDARTASQERMKRELGVLFQDVSHVHTLVVLFEDLHWADVSTIDLLNYLGARLGSMRVLVVVTYRPSEMMLTRHPYLRIRQDLQAAGVLRELPLDFLTLEDVRRYLGLEFPEHRFPEAFEVLVHAKTEGSPLFMVDLLRYLKDRGVVAQVQGHWTLARSVPDVARDLPETLRATIDRKIERLDETSRKLLVAASVQGHEFDSAVVAGVTGADPADVEEALEGLERVHALVRRIHDQELPDRTLSVRYRFVHVLYQNALYASLQPTRRASLSGRVAQALVKHHGERDEGIASELAMLFEAARDAAQAARWFHVAAQHAVGLIALREAVALSRRGLAAVDLLPAGPERDGLELALQMNLGFALRSVEGWAAPEVERIYVRARTLCDQLGSPPQLFPALWGLTLYHAIRGDLAVFLPLAEQLLVRAREVDSRVFLVGAHQMLGSVHEFLGNTVTSNRHYDEALALYDPAHTPLFTQTFGLDPGMISLSLSPRPLWCLGFPDRAVARVEDTVALAREHRQPVSMVFAICLASNIRLLRGESEASVAHAEEEIALCREYGLAQEMEWGRSFRGLALANLGRVDEGIAELQDSLATQRRISAGLLRGMFLTYLAEALALAGRHAEGLAAIDEALEHGERSLEHFYDAESWRVRGDLLRLSGDTAGAASAYERALERAAGQGALSLELRAAMGLARLRAGEGDRAGARALLAGIYARFTEGFDTGDLSAARALVSDLESAR